MLQDNMYMGCGSNSAYKLRICGCVSALQLKEYHLGFEALDWKRECSIKNKPRKYI